MENNTKYTGRFIGIPVRVKKLHPDAVIPEYAHSTDAGLDLTAVSVEYKNGAYIYGTGLAFEIPDGYVGLLFPRSSNCKKDLYLTNSVGVVDSGYRGEVKLIFKIPDQRFLNTLDYPVESNVYDVGDRVGQLIIMPYPKISLIESDELSDSDRGVGGYGSTGK